jgi:hypothetical protein
MTKSSPKTEPGAEKRFEQAVDYMLKTKPKPHAPLKKKKRAKKSSARASSSRGAKP